MKTFLSFGLNALVLSGGMLLSVAAHAQSSPDQALFEQRLKQQYPSTTFKNVRSTPVQGIFEVQMGENVTYVDASGRYFFFGRLYDMPQQVDLTEARIQEVNKIDVAQLPLKDALKTVRGNGQRSLIVFSDPDCPYCKRLETNLKGLDNVTIYTFLYPLESLHPEAKGKAVSVWCNKEPVKAWDAIMLENKEPAVARCDNPVEKTIALGNRLGISGTPTMFAMDGRKRAGAADAQSISNWLDQTGKAVQK